MKKFTVLALAALLVVAFAMPASALENIFGGYWHTRFLIQSDFDGNDTGANDISEVNTRTRLYYTAKLNDKLKLVNKFEMDTVWGDKRPTVAGTNPINWGDAGADGVSIEIKNSYADFNVGPVNFLVGAHNYKLGRGFIVDDDAIGIHAIWKVNDGLYLPFAWKKDVEGGVGKNNNDQDIDSYVFAPIIMLSKDIKINPYYAFLNSKEGVLLPGALTGRVDDINIHVLGVDFDAKMGPTSLWFTGIMQLGSWSTQDNLLGLAKGTDVDMKGYLLAAGGKFDLGKADIHGQVFYATGEENGFADKEVNGYFTTSSTTYYWAEILGGGVFDGLGGGSGAQTAPAWSCGVAPSNIMAANLGVTVKPMDKLSVTADLWYAKLAEENSFGEDQLGIEADLRLTYKLIEGLNLDVVGAYLFAGDAAELSTGGNGKNESDPYELGMQISLSF